MILIGIIDTVVILGLSAITFTKGFERALPFFAFVVVLAPPQSNISLGVFDLSTQRVALIALIALYLVAGKPGIRPRTPLPLRYLILLSVGWLFLSCLNSVVPLVSVKVAISEAVEYYVLYLIFVRTLSDTSTIHRILYGIVSAMIVCAVLGVGEVHSIWNVAGWFPPMEQRFNNMIGPTERGVRIQTTFPHPIHYGAALAVAIPLALYLISVSKSAKRRAFLWVGVFLMFYNIYKTGSRGPWLALGLSLVCLFVLCRGKLRGYILGLVLLSSLTLIVRPGVLRSLLDDYYATTDPNSPEGASYDYRYALLNVSTKAVDQHFSRAIWGYGPESFYFLHLRGPFLGKPDWLFLSCDSTWIGFMVETGYVGLTLMVLLLGAPALMTLSDYRHLSGPASRLSGVLFSNLMAFYFMMVSVAMYSWGQIAYLLWILIAISIAHRRLVREGSLAVVPDARDLPISHWERGGPRERLAVGS